MCKLHLKIYHKPKIELFSKWVGQKPIASRYSLLLCLTHLLSISWLTVGATLITHRQRTAALNNVCVMYLSTWLRHSKTECRIESFWNLFSIPYPRNVVVVPKYLTKKPPITAPQPRPNPVKTNKSIRVKCNNMLFCVVLLFCYSCIMPLDSISLFVEL